MLEHYDAAASSALMFVKAAAAASLWSRNQHPRVQSLESSLLLPQYPSPCLQAALDDLILN
jgi:hypothetical protein